MSCIQRTRVRASREMSVVVWRTAPPFCAQPVPSLGWWLCQRLPPPGVRLSTCQRTSLPGKDSNLEFQGQNLASCHYSTRQGAGEYSFDLARNPGYAAACSIQSRYSRQ